MKASGIIAVLGGVGALALLGLMVVMGGDAPEPVRPPVSELRAGASASRSAEGTAGGRVATGSQAPGTAPSRPGAAPRPSSEGAQPAQASATGPAGSGEASAQARTDVAGGVGQAGAAGAVEPGPEGGAGTSGAVGAAGPSSEVAEVLEVARRAEREDDRINAVRWLGENGAPQQFDALQDIQIHDPSPQVRAAAEVAVNTLRTRRANEAWPGVTPKADPQDYMRGVNLPSP